jgi:acyl-CoA thioester hydrolase
LSPLAPPSDATITTLTHRVAFFETDAMGVVHHANYLRYFELSRVRWLEEHDRPYRSYIDEGVHFAVTRSEVDYHQSAAFDDELAITTWMVWVRGASLCMAYEIRCEDRVIASGLTEHAAVNDEGRVRRIPRPQRDKLRGLTPDSTR